MSGNGGAPPTVGGKELLWEPEKTPAVLPAAGVPQDWFGDLLVLAVPEDAIDTTGERNGHWNTRPPVV